MRKMIYTYTKSCRVIAVAIAMMLSCHATLQAQEPGRTARDFELGTSIEILANIMRELEANFVEPVTAEELLEAASMGMINATDPYSEYISDEAMSDFEMMTTGRYGGVGSLIRKKGDYVVFANPYEGSPSDLAGIRVGDKILAIAGQDMMGADVADVSNTLKGEPGTDVEVVIERNISGERDTLTLTRRRISIPSVPYAGIIRDNVGYIVHDDFIDGSYEEMRHALERLMENDSLRGVVLDYRSNGGGVLQEAIDIASLFVPRGERIVSIMGRDSSTLAHYTTSQPPIAPELPIVILVSGNSASASEILAGSLQDLDRGVVMGQRTYGKGLVQGTAYVGYNGYLKYTTAKYYTPSGRCIQSHIYNSSGSPATVPDSLVTEHRTRGGRRVYDAGGITPDVHIEPEYVSRFAFTLYAMGYIEDWVDEYMRSHANDSIDVRTFSIDDSDYESFCAFIAERDVPYESETRRAFETLRQAAENDLYDEQLSSVLTELEELIRDDKMSNMQTYRDEIIDVINSDIIKRHAYNRGVAERVATSDAAVDQAIELILNQERYREILDGQELEIE